MELMHIYLVFILRSSILHDCTYLPLFSRPIVQHLFNNFMKLFSICQIFHILPFNSMMGNIFFSSSYFIHIKVKYEAAVDTDNLIYFVLSKQ